VKPERPSILVYFLKVFSIHSSVTSNLFSPKRAFDARMRSKYLRILDDSRAIWTNGNSRGQVHVRGVRDHALFLHSSTALMFAEAQFSDVHQSSQVSFIRVSSCYSNGTSTMFDVDMTRIGRGAGSHPCLATSLHG
jgi:hypothetical protein